MVREPLRSIILCALALVWVSERAQVRAILSSSAPDPCWSETVEKAERDKLQVDCLPGSPAFVVCEVARISYALVDFACVLTDLAETTPLQLRGPPETRMLV
jgi:hypothetical protein